MRRRRAESGRADRRNSDEGLAVDRYAREIVSRTARPHGRVWPIFVGTRQRSRAYAETRGEEVPRRWVDVEMMPVGETLARGRVVHAGGLTLFDLAFPPDFELPPHAHENASVAVTIGGSLQTKLASGVSYQSSPNSVMTMPAGDVHSNVAGPGGARLIVVEASPAALEAELSCCAHLLHDVRHCRDHRAGALAWTVAQELAAPDEITPLMLGGIAREMLAATARLTEPHREALRPRWLLRGLEVIHARYSDALGLNELARKVGVHPVYFSRAFRAHMGCTLGAYLRKLRVDRAADMLASSEESIADIALQVGFADQSHLSNVFRRLRGITPSRYREESRRH
jgi:AraC family transcriptional regulator